MQEICRQTEEPLACLTGKQIAYHDAGLARVDNVVPIFDPQFETLAALSLKEHATGHDQRTLRAISAFWNIQQEADRFHRIRIGV